jgi:hypothetical protein
MVSYHVDMLLGNDCETNNETTAVARQWPARTNGSTVGSGARGSVVVEALCYKPEVRRIASR